MRSEDANLRPERAHTPSAASNLPRAINNRPLSSLIYTKSPGACAGLHFNKAGPLFMAFIGSLGEENGEKMIY
jgi:hypothetical protein